MNTEKMRCNSCGRFLRQNEDRTLCLEDYVTINKTWGYFSTKDGVKQTVLLCEDCCMKIVGSFAIKPLTGEETELLGV